MKASLSSCCVIHVQYIGKQNRSKIRKKMLYVIVYILNVVMDAFIIQLLGFPRGGRGERRVPHSSFVNSTFLR